MQLGQFLSFLFVTAAAVMALALLIAFNSIRITVEERRREHATMRAFGLPVRTVIGVVAAALLFLARRLRHLNLPDTLRVME